MGVDVIATRRACTEQPPRVRSTGLTRESSGERSTPSALESWRMASPRGGNRGKAHVGLSRRCGAWRCDLHRSSSLLASQVVGFQNQQRSLS